MAKYGFTYKKHMMYPDHYIIDADSLDDALQKIVPVGIDGMTQWHMQVIDFESAIIKRIAMSMQDGEMSAVEVPDWTFGELTPYEYFEDPNGAAADINAALEAGALPDGSENKTGTMEIDG
jgi:hypothetical protein